SPYDEPTVLLMALEAPRIVVDQLAREPEGLAASLALALDAVAHPKQRLAMDALLVVGPEHARVFGEGGWTREQLQQRLFELDIRKPRGDVFLDELDALLRERGHHVVRTAKPTFTKVAPPDLRREIAERCDAVIEALAD